MGLGEKLQAAYQKVHTKLGMQDGDIVFRKVTETPASDFGVAHTSATNADVTVTEGIRVSRVQAHNLDAAGKLRIGDLRLLVPGNLVTEAQLTDARIVYGGLNHTIVQKTYKEILGGVGTAWIIFAREER